MATTFMNLTLPTVSTTLGPLWATEINAAITSIDSHDHTSGQGNPVPVAGMVIDADLAYGDNSITGLGSASFTSLIALLTDINTVYVKDGDLYSNDGAGNQVRITAGGTLNVGTVGGIGGDYGSTAATAFYTDASTTYFFQDSASAAADFNVGAIACTDVTPSGNVTITGTLGVTGVSTVAAITATTVTATTIATGALASALTGYGLVKPGMMIAVASNLTGSHAIPSTGTVDSSGYILCDGAAIPGSQTVSGTTPDLSDNRFLMGAATAGTTGGNASNQISLQHSHTVNSHTHSTPSHTHSTPSHSHSAGSLWALIGGSTSTGTLNTSIYYASSGNNFAATRYINNGSANFSHSTISGTGYNGVDVEGTTGSSSGTTGSSSGTSGSTAPGTNNQLSTTQSILPLYVTCQYLMRVK
jgi:hypothetical protein